MAIYDDSVGLENLIAKSQLNFAAYHITKTATEAAHQSVAPATGSPVPMQLDTCSAHSLRTCSPPRGWTVSLQCSCLSLHQDLPSQTPTSSGKYPSTWPCCFHAFYANSATTLPHTNLLQSLTSLTRAPRATSSPMTYWIGFICPGNIMLRSSELRLSKENRKDLGGKSTEHQH